MEDLILKEVSPGLVEVGVGQVNTDCKDEIVRNLCFQGDGLTYIQQERMQTMLPNWGHLFAKHDEDFGCTGQVQHNTPPTMYQEVRSLLKDGSDKRELQSMGRPPSSSSARRVVSCGFELLIAN